MGHPNKIISTLPALGQAWPGIEGSTYHGVATNPDGTLYALVELAGSDVTMTWHEQVAEAARLEARLPSRVDGQLLHANPGKKADTGWFFLEEQYSDSYAWSQGFNDGCQLGSKSAAGRARFVRRLPLESFDPFEGLAKRSAESLSKLRAAGQALLSACDAADTAIAEVAEAA